MIIVPKDKTIAPCWYPGCKKQPHLHMDKRKIYFLSCDRRGHSYTADGDETVIGAIDCWNTLKKQREEEHANY